MELSFSGHGSYGKKAPALFKVGSACWAAFSCLLQDCLWFSGLAAKKTFALSIVDCSSQDIEWWQVNAMDGEIGSAGSTSGMLSKGYAAGIPCSIIFAQREQPVGIASSLKLYSGW